MVIGTRSALFLPINDLGLTVVDEEHDNSYKQEEQVIYHGRDMAILRAKYAKSFVILASATPALETLANIDSGKYAKVELTQRHNDAIMPQITTIDLRKSKNKSLSGSLISAIGNQLDQKNQIMLYLNRRGYAAINICQICGQSINCPYCSTGLVEHKKSKNLICHYCGYTSHPQLDCNGCNSKNSVISHGFGVEKVHEEIQQTFPKAKVQVFASDLFNTSKQLEEAITKIHEGQVDIIIGTQILAKGHHFPKLAMVGILDGDALGQAFDLRCNEKNYQLMQQVAGRAGRSKGMVGQVLVQTFNPDSHIIQALLASNRDHFIDYEKKVRKLVKMPPYGRLVAFIISHHSLPIVKQTALEFKHALQQELGNVLEIMGPTPAPIEMIRGKYRLRILLKHNLPQIGKIHNTIRSCIQRCETSYCSIKADVDPYSFF